MTCSAESCALEMCEPWLETPLTSTRSSSGDTTANKNGCVCHAPISVIMGNYHRCRFSGRCKRGVKVKNSATVTCFTLEQVEIIRPHRPDNKISQTFKRRCCSIADKEVMNSSWAQEELHTFYASSSSLLRCNTCVSLKRRESSQGKWLLMCFRYCLVFHSCERSYLIYEASSSHRRITAGIPRAQISK